MTELDRGSPDGGFRLSVTAALVGVLVILVAWNIIGNLALPGPWYVPANLAVGAAVIALAKLAGTSWDDLALRPANLRRGLAVGGLAAAAVAVTVVTALLIPPLRSFFENDAVAADSTFDHWFVPAIRIPIGTALFEELLFRSVLFGLLARARSTRYAVVGSAIVFGLWHVVPAWETAPVGPASVAGAVVGTVAITTVAGVVFALLRMRSGSIIASVIAHSATNSFAYLGALVVFHGGS